MARENKLTAKQRAFVNEYLVDLCASAAYRRAGYRARGNSAEVSSVKLLRNPKIAAAIAEAMRERAKRTQIDIDRVLRELACVAFLDIGKAFTPEGALKPLDKMDENTRRAISGLEVAALIEDGERIGTLKKIKIADKIAALEKIARHLGMFNDKLILKGDAENPLVVLIQQIQGNSLKPVRHSAWGGDEPE